MPNATSSAASPTSLSKPSSLAADPSPSASLEALFSEIVTFANHLRQAKALLHRQDNCRPGATGVMQTLALHGARTVSHIARMRLTSRQNIQILVNHLAAVGHVSLTSNPAHKRSGLVTLTESGRALLTAVQGREDQFLADLAARVPAADVSSAALVLRQIRQSLPRADKPASNGKPRPAAGRQRQAEHGKAVVFPNQAPMVEGPPAPRAEPELAENELPVNLL